VVRNVTQPPVEGLGGEAEDHLHRLMATWQLIADLSFADLLLFVSAGEDRFRIVGQMRPYTARTLYPADLVGEVVDTSWHPFVERAWREQRRLAREKEKNGANAAGEAKTTGAAQTSTPAPVWSSLTSASARAAAARGSLLCGGWDSLVTSSLCSTTRMVPSSGSTS